MLLDWTLLNWTLLNWNDLAIELLELSNAYIQTDVLVFMLAIRPPRFSLSLERIVQDKIY